MGTRPCVQRAARGSELTIGGATGATASPAGRCLHQAGGDRSLGQALGGLEEGGKGSIGTMISSNK